MSKPNESAFPTDWVYSCDGLTKRELFAAMAMQGLLANPNDIPSIVTENGGPLQSQLARVSLALANALIKELEKSNEP